MKKYTLIILMIILLVGCSKPDEETVNEIGETPTEEPIVVLLSEEEQKEVLKGYYKLLSPGNKKEEIINYIDEYVDKLNVDFVDEILISLEEYLDLTSITVDEKLDILTNYYDYSSMELKSYLDISKIEEELMFTDGEGLNVDLLELLNRALRAESHLSKYYKGKTYDRIKDYYVAYITGSILGTGNQYIYAEEGSSRIKQEVLDIYQKIIDENKSSHTSEILQLYIGNLSMDNEDMNGENVLKFYDDLQLIIENYIR